MYSITLELNSTSETIGKVTTNKMTAKAFGKNSSFRFSVKNLFEHSVAEKHVCEVLNIFLLLDMFLCFINVLNENLLLLNFLSQFLHLVAFI